MDLAEISPDLKNLTGKCYVSRSVRVSSGFGEKIRDRTNLDRILEKKTLPPTGEVVGLAIGRLWSGRIYLVGRATS